MLPWCLLHCLCCLDVSSCVAYSCCSAMHWFLPPPKSCSTILLPYLWCHRMPCALCISHIAMICTLWVILCMFLVVLMCCLRMSQDAWIHLRRAQPWRTFGTLGSGHHSSGWCSNPQWEVRGWYSYTGGVWSVPPHVPQDYLVSISEGELEAQDIPCTVGAVNASKKESFKDINPVFVPLSLMILKDMIYTSPTAKVVQTNI